MQASQPGFQWAEVCEHTSIKLSMQCMHMYYCNHACTALASGEEKMSILLCFAVCAVLLFLLITEKALSESSEQEM
jgi:hypothetical protein